MNVFQLMRLVLDETFAQVPGSNDTARGAYVRSALNELSGTYAKLGQGASSPSYASAAVRTGYVARYVTSHAGLVAEVMWDNKELRALFKEARLRVACVGGGPGSDFLGILKHMMRTACTASLKCYLLDKEQAWGDSWSDIDEKLDGATFDVSTHFQPLDIGDQNTWMVQTKYLSSDLFTMIYFVSEVWSLRADAEAYFKHLFGYARSGAYFLYIDNNATTFSNWIDGLAAANNLITVEAYNTKAFLPSDEEKADLGPYLKLLGNPKLTANVAVRVFRKP